MVSMKLQVHSTLTSMSVSLIWKVLINLLLPSLETIESLNLNARMRMKLKSGFNASRSILNNLKVLPKS